MPILTVISVALPRVALTHTTNTPLTIKGFTVRMATRPKKKLQITDEIRNDFLMRVGLMVSKFNIPRDLVINFDETGIQLCPASTRTYHKRGDHQVEIIGLDDKRQLTCGLAASMTGVRLDIQLIFAGTTDRCHPTFELPGTNYFHSQSHWQDVTTTKGLLESIIIPFFRTKKQELGLPQTQWSLLLWDVWSSHIAEKTRALCDKNFIKMVIITPNFTKDLQVMDLVVNAQFKKLFRNEFCNWCTEEINAQIATGLPAALAELNVGKKTLKEV